MVSRGRGSQGRGPSHARSVGAWRGGGAARSSSSTRPNDSNCASGNTMQKANTVGNSLLLKAATRKNAVGFRSPQDMQRFLNAALTECATDATFVLDCLGSPNNEGLSRLGEICSAPFSVQADSTRSAASFQTVICALLHLITLPIFANTVLSQCYNPIIAVVESNLDMHKVWKCVLELSKPGVLVNPDHASSLWRPSTWVELLQIVVSFLAKLLSRSSIVSAQQLSDMQSHVTHLQQAYHAFQGSSSPAGQGTLSNSLGKLDRLVASKLEEHHSSQAQAAEAARQGVLHCQHQAAASTSQGRAAHPGPGVHRAQGPRHNNDHASIADIKIAPTQEELLCCIAPYLPGNQAGTVMHLPKGSQAAHLDMQFRQFRHDGLAELFSGFNEFHGAGGIAALHGKRQHQHLPKAVQDGSLQTYLAVQIQNLVVPQRGPAVSFEVTFEELSHNAIKSLLDRQAFWEKTRRLQHGTLVLVWTETLSRTPDSPKGATDVSITPCVVSDRDVHRLAPRDTRRRPAIGLRVCEGYEASSEILLAATGSKLPGQTVMLQASGSSYFAFEPFLKAMQRNQSLPLANYITQPPSAVVAAGNHGGSSSSSRPTKLVSPAAYLVDRSTQGMDLSSLIPPGRKTAAAMNALCNVNVLDGRWPEEALAQYTTLDPAQRAAIKAALASELSLIQGPPGTGKSYVGIELIKILLANTCPTSAAAGKLQREHAGLRLQPVIGPILIVCLTNHALDQFLEELHKAGIRRIVRVGTGCKTDVLIPYTLSKISKESAATPAQKHLQYSCHSRCEELAKTIRELQHQLESKELSWSAIETLLPVLAPNLYDSLSKQLKQENEDGFKSPRVHLQQSWRLWLDGKDSSSSTRYAAATAAAAAATAPRVIAFNSFGPLQNQGPVVHNTEALDSKACRRATQRGISARERDVSELLVLQDAWSMTRAERHRLQKHMADQVRSEQLEKLQRTVTKFAEVREELRCVYADVDLNVLKDAQVVGMTTNGVATKQELVAAMASKVILVEEAAEVMEIHILASLAPTVEHAILIGDHEQLRPKANTWEMQVESRKGYDLDMSFFERLVFQGHPVATLQQQRRMRPSISSLIRDTIYPHLQDHAQVLQYPAVRGIAHNVFFWDHRHPEGGNEDSKSKVNLEEARMAARLALYMVQQGYAAGEVTILTAYVGQLRLVIRELSKLMDVVVGDSDAEQLADLAEKDATGEQAGSPNDSGKQGAKAVPSRTSLRDAVRAATIDNFQGEESTIVILSLVRSNMIGSIGFLATSNRVNVALSRAKHGMIIIGDEETLSAKKRTRPTMMTKVLDMLQEGHAVGETLPVVCSLHPETTNLIRTAKDFDLYVKDGGCSLPCTTRLACGHTCPRQCHPDDQGHKLVKCPKDCQRLQQPCRHPCPKMCHEDCGLCHREIADVPLPCGHTVAKLPCHKAQEPDSYQCKQKVEVGMQCGHSLQVKCFEAAKFREDATLCSASCAWDLPCGHACKQRCGQCLQKKLDSKGLVGTSAARVPRSNYIHPGCRQKCGRDLLCGHACSESCHGGTTCPLCSQPCKAACHHGRCKGRCTDPCQPCAEPCAWHCPHQGGCELPCGAPCSRLPCDARCSKKLPCGHQCPGVCGDKCPPKKFCIQCGDLDITAYDAMMNEHNQLRLYSKAESELDIASDPLVFLGCGHVMHMSTMDQYMSLDQMYSKENDQWAAPCQLGGVKTPLKGCPLCRQPLSQVMRYGRVLNKMKLDQADIQFAGQCHILLGKADAAYQQAVAARQAADQPGVLTAPQLPRPPQQRGFQQVRRQPALLDATADSLMQARRMTDEAAKAFELLKKTCRRPPTVAVHESTQATLQRLADRQAIQGTASFSPKVAAQQTHVPRPDRRPECKAHVGLCQCNALWSSINMQLLQHKLQGHLTLDPKSNRLKEAKELLAGATSRYHAALAQVKHAGKLAEQEAAQQTGLQAVTALIRLQQQRVQDVGISRKFQHVLGETPEWDKKAKALQLELLAEAEAACAKGLQTAASSRALSVVADLAALQAGFARLHKLVQVTDNSSELEAVVRALVSNAPSLAGPGFTNQGHWYECANGHPYIITECGGATQEGRCPECGARIGGTGHRLQTSNRESRALRAIAEGIRRQPV